MINQESKPKIIEIWDEYVKAGNKVHDPKGNVFEDDRFNEKRLDAIIEIKAIIKSFLNAETNVYIFKTAIDSYNKKNNLWGFTAIKGQMFFNQLVKVNEEEIENFASLLKTLIVEPKNLEDAIEKIAALENHTKSFYDTATDRRKVPNPKSCGYFLSYFWQIQNPDKWAIFYTSLLESFTDIGIWENQPTQSEAYRYFFNLNAEIKEILSTYSDNKITNWKVEHAFWQFQEKARNEKKPKVKIQPKIITDVETVEKEPTLTASINLSDYIIPKVTNLIQVGNDNSKSASAKGSEYEKLVAEIFRFLDFDVEFLGQGSGRNPDAILKLREENTAFLVDAKAYTKGYSLGVDDRAIKEYINYHCPRLQKDGYHKIGFIIVSNSFNSNFDSFINEITWNTQIKRFILMTSEALLYLLAYKIKDNLSSSQIVENIISCGNLIEAQNIIEEFDDV